MSLMLFLFVLSFAAWTTHEEAKKTDSRIMQLLYFVLFLGTAYVDFRFIL